MIEELRTASSLLSAALERYLAACSSIADCYDPTNAFKGISRAILDLIPGEVERIASYETKFKQAKSIINQTRNIIPVIAPINALPPDILSHIFELVLGAQQGYFENQHDLKPFPVKHPETLAYVCSRWRQIAINSRTLWSRADVIPFQGDRRNRRLLERAEVFAARADPSPLDIYIIGPSNHDSPDIYLDAFCASIATRARSLNLLECRNFTNTHLSCLQSFFANCTPGTLNKLVITGITRITWIETSESRTNPRNQLLDVPRIHLEGCLIPINVLELSGAYFHWDSQAYHGLVELRLNTYSYVSPHITELQLRGILAGSPRLRVLHLGLEIVDLLPYDASRAAVILDDLELLDLRYMRPSQYEVLSQILSSGSKPLRLSIKCRTQSPIFSDRLASYFARSNVTELFIQALDRQPCPLFEVVRSLHVPNLRALFLTGFHTEPKHTAPPLPQSSELHTPSLSQLDSLHLTRCDIVADDVQRVATAAPLQMLTLSGCLISTGYGKAEAITADEDRHALVEMAPVVRFVPFPGGRGLLQDWYPWD